MLIELELKGLPAAEGAAVEADAPALGRLPAVPKAPGRAPTGALVTQRFDDGSALYEDGLVYDPSSQKFRKPRPPAPETAAAPTAAAEGETAASAPEEKRAGKADRRVRTPEGARLFGQPIGSIIREDVLPPAAAESLRRARLLLGREPTADEVVRASRQVLREGETRPTPAGSVIIGGTDRRGPATPRARPLEMRPDGRSGTEAGGVSLSRGGVTISPTALARMAQLPSGDDDPDKAKAQAIADFGSSKDPGSPLHTIRKRKAAVKFYAQKRDGLSKDDAAKLADEYELEAIDSARKGNGIPKAAVMKGRKPGGSPQQTSGGPTKPKSFGVAGPKKGQRVELKPGMPDGGKAGVVTAVEKYTVRVKFDDGTEASYARGTGIMPSDKPVPPVKTPDEAPSTISRAGLLDLLRGDPATSDAMSKDDVAAHPWSSSTEWYYVHVPTEYEKGDDGKFREVAKDEPAVIGFSPSSFDPARRDAVQERLEAAGYVVKREDDDDLVNRDLLVGTPAQFERRDRAIAKAIERSESRTPEQLDQELASLVETLGDMTEEDGWRAGLESIDTDKLSDALAFAERTNSPYVTSKLASFSEFSVSRALARRLTGIKRKEGKSVDELIDLDMWEAFKLGLGVEAKDVCRVTETKAVRRVATPEGARKYGEPIGTVITPDMIDKVRRAAGAVPKLPSVSPGAGRGANPEAPRLRQQRRVAAVARDRAGDAVADRRIGEREELAKLNKKRRAQGKPPLLKLPNQRQRPSSGGYGVTKKAMNARGDGDRPMKAGAYTRGDPRNDPEYATYVQELQAKLDAAMAAGLDSETLHTVEIPGAGRTYTAERSAEHQRIIDDIMKRSEHVPTGRRAIMMGGLPGAGKSTFLRQHGAEIGLDVTEDGDPTNAIVVNPDEMKSLLINGVGADGMPLVPAIDGLKKGEMAELVHEESSHLANLLAERALAAGKDVVFDVTLGDGLKAKRKYLTNDRGTGALDRGYNVEAVFVDGDMATSLHRAGLRHKQPNDKTGERGYSGRFVRYEHIASQAVRDPKARTADGEVPKSQNRVEYDSLVADGTFTSALRYDNKTGELVTDARPEEASEPKPDPELQAKLRELADDESIMSSAGVYAKAVVASRAAGYDENTSAAFASQAQAMRRERAGEAAPTPAAPRQSSPIEKAAEAVLPELYDTIPAGNDSGDGMNGRTLDQERIADEIAGALRDGKVGELDTTDQGRLRVALLRARDDGESVEAADAYEALTAELGSGWGTGADEELDTEVEERDAAAAKLQILNYEETIDDDLDVEATLAEINALIDDNPSLADDPEVMGVLEKLERGA